MKKFADLLIERISETSNPTVMGIDPLIEYVPDSIQKKYGNDKEPSLESAAMAITDFNKRLLDCVQGIIPVVKPQLAYFEMLGVPGIKSFFDTVKYAKEKGFLVIADGKRNDILSTASCYAKAYLGEKSFDETKNLSGFYADALTVNPYLGFDGIKPFVDECEKNGKGIFILVRTSNPSAVDFQDIKTESGEPLYIKVAEKVFEWGKGIMGENKYSSVGAVVGATWPEQASELRKTMPHTIILVPGYGAQGGKGDSAAKSFDKDGRGAIVNASRSLMCAYKKNEFAHEDFEEATYKEALRMKDDLNSAISGKSD